MVQRVTFRRRHSYHTKSNIIRKVKTPGGKLVVQYARKLPGTAKCGDCAVMLPGIKAVRPKKLRSLKKRERRVSRAYGGSVCGPCVRIRIVRAFLVEEQKIVKNLSKSKSKK